MKNEFLIKIIAVLIMSVVGALIGGFCGLIGSYLIWLSDSRYAFGYSLMYFFGGGFGVYNLFCYSREYFS